MDFFKRLEYKIKFIKVKRQAKENQKKLQKIYNETGADFLGHINNDTLGTDKVNGHAYEASFEMPNILANLKIKDRDALIDVGCGKGYILYLFSRLPFSLIDGIEYNKELCDIAQKNIEILFDDKNRYNIYCGDARNFNYDKYNYFFLSNPFNEEGTSEFIQTLKESISNCPRDIILIYQFPTHLKLFTDDNTFRLAVVSDGCAILKHDCK